MGHEALLNLWLNSLHQVVLRDVPNRINILGLIHGTRMLRLRQMKKADLISEIARQNGGNPGNAADQLDRAVNRIICSLRDGKPARIPGLGTLNPGKIWTFKAE
jgi:hypothetical protein